MRKPLSTCSITVLSHPRSGDRLLSSTKLCQNKSPASEWDQSLKTYGLPPTNQNWRGPPFPLALLGDLDSQKPKKNQQSASFPIGNSSPGTATSPWVANCTREEATRSHPNTHIRETHNWFGHDSVPKPMQRGERIGLLVSPGSIPISPLLQWAMEPQPQRTSARP